MSIAASLAESMKMHSAKHKKAKESKKSEKPKSMEIEGAEGGGYIATHRSASGPYQEPKKFALKNHSALMKHVKEYMCPDATEEDAEEEK